MKPFKSVTKETLRRQLAEARTEFSLSEEEFRLEDGCWVIPSDKIKEFIKRNYDKRICLNCQLKPKDCSCGDWVAVIEIDDLLKFAGDKLNGSDEK